MHKLSPVTPNTTRSTGRTQLPGLSGYIGKQKYIRRMVIVTNVSIRVGSDKAVQNSLTFP